LLHGGLDEDTQRLFKADNLKPMHTGGIDGIFLECYGSEGASKLIYLEMCEQQANPKP
jgi:hypothetical protein